jgi:16S rRNA processing protein RimM
MSASKASSGPAGAPARFDPATIAIGVLGRPHGVRGELTLRLFNEAGPPPEDLQAVTLVRDGRQQARIVSAWRPCAGGLLVTIEGVSSRDEAAALTGNEVRVARAELPPLGPGEYYVADLPGCQVLREDGAAIGVVVDTFWNGGHDIMVVRGPEPESAEHLIPLVPDFIREVDTALRVVRVAWDA